MPMHAPAGHQAARPTFSNADRVHFCYRQVSVTLWNTGDDAYRADEYGRFITVTRTFTGNGTKWQMTSKRGNIVSTSKQEMEAVMDHLSIDAGTTHCLW
jgi:hypothetical protein